MEGRERRGNAPSSKNRLNDYAFMHNQTASATGLNVMQCRTASVSER